MTDNKITLRRAQILNLVLGTEGGMSARELGQRIGIKTQSAAEHLRKLRDIGLIGPSSQGGPGSKWVALTTAIALQKTAAERTAKHRNRVRRENLAAHWQAGPHRLIVPAAAAPPLYSAAPNSVFNMAA